MAQLKKEYKKKDTFIKRWGALFILLAFFLASWGGQYITQMEVEKEQAQQHGQEFSMQEFGPQFWSSTLENWQSEWLQLAAQALLVVGLSSYIFRKQDEEHYKTQLMIEELKTEIRSKKKR